MAEDRSLAVRAELSGNANERVDALEWFKTLGSTNDYLSAAAAPGRSRLRVAIAEEQTRGRGRGANRWTSASGAGLWMSLAYTFSPVPSGLNTLTLALGICVAQRLAAVGAAGVMLKWPNDLMLNDGKLGGILVETRSAGVDATAVCGIGINVRAPSADVLERDARAMAPVGLESVLDRLPSMETLAAEIIGAALDAFDGFEANGFAAFVPYWDALDWLRGRRVDVSSPPMTGVASGIDADGRLNLRADGQLVPITSGTVRVAED